MSGTSPRSRLAELGRRLTYRVHRHVVRSPYLVARERRFGLRFRFKTEDAVGRCIYQTGVYQEGLTRFLLEDLDLRPGDVVVDAGANLGWFSILLDRVAPEGATIYAFEPDPGNFGLLTENVERNGTESVVPVQAALADASCRRPLFRYPDKNRGRHSLCEISGAAETVEVAVTSLDRFWRERGLGERPVGLLKVDVEGFECRLLRGADDVVNRCRVVVTEYAPGLLRRSGDAPEELLGPLCDAGFVPHRVDEEGLEAASPEALEGSEGTQDLVWLRPEAGTPGTG